MEAYFRRLMIILYSIRLPNTFQENKTSFLIDIRYRGFRAEGSCEKVLQI